jgi:hypothetical protein
MCHYWGDFLYWARKPATDAWFSYPEQKIIPMNKSGNAIKHTERYISDALPFLPHMTDSHVHLSRSVFRR